MKMKPRNARSPRPGQRATRRVSLLDPPRHIATFRTLTPTQHDQWARATRVPTHMRNGLPFGQALREEHLSRATALRLLGSALDRRPDGRILARPTDSLLRALVVPTPDGQREVIVRGSRAAARIGDYHNAVQRFTTRGDSTALARFEGAWIRDASGRLVPFLTDRDALTRLGQAGRLSFESIYARSR